MEAITAMIEQMKAFGKIPIQNGYGKMSHIHNKKAKAYHQNENHSKVGRWEYAQKYCRHLTLAGYNHWQLPSLDELEDAFDEAKT